MSNKMMDYQLICEQVCQVARKAGEYIAEQRKHFSFSDVEFKGEHNLVSYVDKESEKMTVAALNEILPGSGFITEEGTATSHGERFLWIIDPLDGTTNFVHGIPPYCVSIALMEAGELVVGVVYEVTHGELFYAWKGSDAFLNGEKITCSKVNKLENALIAVGFSYATITEVDDFLDAVAYYLRNTDGIRRVGAATADLVYVACGRVDAFSQVKLSAWDVAAGAFIAQRAGAVVTDYAGGDNFVFGREIVAANPWVYDEFIKTVK